MRKSRFSESQIVENGARLFPRNLRSTQKICDGIVLKVALIERRWISPIEQLPGLTDVEVDTRPPIFGTVLRRVVIGRGIIPSPNHDDQRR